MERQHALPLYIKSLDIIVIFKKIDDQQWCEMGKSIAPIFEDWVMQKYLHTLS